LTDAATTQLTDQRVLFDIPDEIAYFNTANLSPLLQTVRAAGEQGLKSRSEPWRITPPDWFRDVETLRDRAATVFGTAADAMALIPASSYGLATIARNLPVNEGQRILVLHEEYPSNYYTWQRHAQRNGAELIVVHRKPGEDWANAVLAELDERVAIVAVPNDHWTDGALVDLGRIAP
jgi:selenocysteine lyase/cysteine desulfurase